MTTVTSGVSRRRWRIMIGLFAGALFGCIDNAAGWTGAAEITTTYVRPVGTLFIRLIK